MRTRNSHYFHNRRSMTDLIGAFAVAFAFLAAMHNSHEERTQRTR